MITRAEFVAKCLERGDVRGAVEHIMWRVISAAEVPEKTVDPWRDYKLCLNKAIQELCDARNE
jgi:hypothetical protein